MILTRLGNKRTIAKHILPYFPDHKTYIEPFFGAGGMFFAKSLAKYNIVNDIDEDVFNLFQVVLQRKEELVEFLVKMPIHESLLRFWRKNQETDPVLKACRFLLLSNFTYLGKGDALRSGNRNAKEIILQRIENVQLKLKNVVFYNKDFRFFFRSLSQRDERAWENTFVYCDPPYIETTNNYSNSFSKQDFLDLLDLLLARNWNFAVSEFNNPFVVEQAKIRGLNILPIIKRRNLLGTTEEILITNYNPYELQF